MLKILSSFISDKARLVLEYVLVGLLVATLGVSASMYIGKLRQDVKVATLQGQVDALNGEVSSLKGVAQQQDENIQELKRLRYIDASTLGNLLADLKNLSTKDKEFQVKLSKLEASDETVRQYVVSGIPPQLRCMLNETCEQPDPVPASGQKPRPASAPAGATHSGG